MSSEPATIAPTAARTARPPRASYRAKRAKPGSPLTAHGEPLLWLTGGALAVALAMIVSLLALVAYQGFSTFWPLPLAEIKTFDGGVFLGELSRTEHFKLIDSEIAKLPADAAQRARAEMAASDGQLGRRLLRTANFDISGEHFTWIDDYKIESQSDPDWAVILERLTWGHFYGFPTGFLEEDKQTAEGASAAWAKFEQFHSEVRDRWLKRVSLETHALGEISHRQDVARLAVREAELDYGANSPEVQAAEKSREVVDAQATDENAKVMKEIDELKQQNARLQLKLKTADGQEKVLPLEQIVRGYPANQLSWSGKLGIYLSRWAEFLWDNPREANSEGGVFPAIFGTVVMTLAMSLFVAPFGVLAALYLREYAKAGPIVSGVRIAINNLAGVPSVVFGAFGLGFFCYGMGGWIDRQFFAASLPVSTFGAGGLMWASLTLALLTLPVVIVTTEEAIAAVPSSMREGSYACGASKWQTIKRIVLPRALPGIMTGMILAMARGAGEVAPLMLVGAVKLAADMPIDAIFPFVHLQRKFMHLGFHIFDLGFQSSNSEAAKPMVFTTTLLLICIIAFLNIAAVWLRGRLRRKFISSHF